MHRNVSKRVCRNSFNRERAPSSILTWVILIDMRNASTSSRPPPGCPPPGHVFTILWPYYGQQQFPRYVTLAATQSAWSTRNLVRLKFGVAFVRGRPSFTHSFIQGKAKTLHPKSAGTSTKMCRVYLLEQVPGAS